MLDLSVQCAILAGMNKYDQNKIINALGGTVATAKLCKVTKAAVSNWRTSGIPQPREMFLELLRPDLFRSSRQSKKSV